MDSDVEAKKEIVRREETAIQNAQKALDEKKKAVEKANDRYTASKKRVAKYKKHRRDESKRSRARRLRRLKKAEKTRTADGKAYNRACEAQKTAEKKLQELKTKKKMDDISEAIAEHQAEWSNEGKAAIYPTDGGNGASSIIYISPSSNENESISDNVTSWAVDQGDPRSNYARVSGKTITVEGLITGDGDMAYSKWKQLDSWNKSHTELTYQGDIYYDHLLISSLGRTYTGLVDNLSVSITFTYVQHAYITSTRKKHKKSSKSSKTKGGNRHKRSAYLTIKPGDTLWAFSRKYGKSVSWLAKVNHIKNPHWIYPGRKIRVR